MKKTLVSALTTALVVGAASTTFAAANPFSDVPADHWAYDAVSQLAADGVIEGYGDTTFRGNQNITRYEMAQMIAKAMAKTDVSAADKALIDKLAAEFSDELNNLGVRVSNLERNADMVKWNGKAEYTYWSHRDKDTKNPAEKKHNDDQLLFRLEPTAEVNSNWHVHARLDASTDLQQDNADVNGKHGGEDGKQDTDVKLKRIWAQGNYGNFQTKLGKFAQIDDDSIFDTTFSGAEVKFGNKVTFTAGAGRLDADDYVTKPFSNKELVERVKAVLRRIEKYNIPRADIIKTNDGRLLMDLKYNRFLKDGKEITLTKNEFSIVKTLFSSPNKIFTRDEIIELTFGLDYDAYDRAIDSAAHRV